jgi:hypothetical protein
MIISLPAVYQLHCAVNVEDDNVGDGTVKTRPWSGTNRDPAQFSLPDGHFPIPGVSHPSVVARSAPFISVILTSFYISTIYFFEPETLI